jgi:hypothetical protein
MPFFNAANLFGFAGYRRRPQLAISTFPGAAWLFPAGWGGSGKEC